MTAAEETKRIEMQQRHCNGQATTVAEGGQWRHHQQQQQSFNAQQQISNNGRMRWRTMAAEKK
jgi:hypothetical protein